ncbi:hypothetical protein [Streptomyces sp. NPDC001205]
MPSAGPLPAVLPEIAANVAAGQTELAVLAVSRPHQQGTARGVGEQHRRSGRHLRAHRPVRGRIQCTSLFKVRA